MSDNGNKIELKKNLEYFELRDGDYYTMEALCKKYECQHTHISRRVKEFNIPREKLLGKTLYKDSEHFEKKPKATNNFGDSQIKLVSYATLVTAIKEHDQLLEQKLNHLTNAIVRYGDNVRENNRLINEILNHLTIPRVKSENLTTVKMEGEKKDVHS